MGGVELASRAFLSLRVWPVYPATRDGMLRVALFVGHLIPEVPFLGAIFTGF